MNPAFYVLGAIVALTGSFLTVGLGLLGLIMQLRQYNFSQMKADLATLSRDNAQLRADIERLQEQGIHDRDEIARLRRYVTQLVGFIRKRGDEPPPEE